MHLLEGKKFSKQFHQLSLRSDKGTAFNDQSIVLCAIKNKILSALHKLHKIKKSQRKILVQNTQYKCSSHTINFWSYHTYFAWLYLLVEYISTDAHQNMFDSD